MTSPESSPAAPASDPSQEGVEAREGARETPPSRDPEARERSDEAKSYRLRLREAERTIAERDAVIGALRARIDDVDRVEVERVAEQRGMASGADVWTAAQLADLRSDEGVLDVERVQTRVDELLRERPHWKRPSVDLGGGPRTSAPPERELGLATLLGKRERR
jgi:hypothetical protein